MSLTELSRTLTRRPRAAVVVLTTLLLLAVSAVTVALAQSAPGDSAVAAEPDGAEYSSEYLLPIEQTPYSISFRIAFQDDPFCTDRFRADVLEHLESTLWATMSIQWRCSVQAAGSAEVSGTAWLDAIRPADYADLLEEYDKIVFCYVWRDIDRWRVELRELDLTFLQLGPVFRTACRTAGQLPRVITEAAFQAFTPLAAVDQVKGRRVVIRLKAGRLKLFDGRMRLVQPGAVFRPFRVRVNPDTGQEEAVPVHWAYLVVTEVSGARAVCQLVTAVRGAVPPPAQDPTMVQLLGVKSNGEPSVLTVVDRETEQPVVALEVESRTLADRSRHPLGTTDFDGRIVIPPSNSLQLLYLRQGKRFLAILPVLPGSGTLPVARVPTFEERLELEGRAAALQEQVVDYVVERTVLINTLKTLVEEQKWDKAEEVARQLRALPPKEYFTEQLEQLKSLAQQLAGEDRPVPVSVKRMIDETEKLIERYVDPAVIEEAIDDYRSLREGRPAGA